MDNPVQLQFWDYRENPPIMYELKEMPENIKVRRHCNVYPCEVQSTHYFISTFGTVAKVICGVCDYHAHALDKFMKPIKIGTN